MSRTYYNFIACLYLRSNYQRDRCEISITNVDACRKPGAIFTTLYVVVFNVDACPKPGAIFTTFYVVVFNVDACPKPGAIFTTLFLRFGDVCDIVDHHCFQ
jgi:hypothetical protein